MITPEKTATHDSPIQIRSIRKTRWFWIANEVFDEYAPRLGPEGLALYAALARYANNATGKCWPSLTTLSKKLACPVERLAQALERLLACGLIHVAHTEGKTIMTLLDPSPQAPVPPLPDPLPALSEEQHKNNTQFSSLSSSLLKEKEKESGEKVHTATRQIAVDDPAPAAPWTPYTVPEAVREEQCQVNCEGVAALRALLYPWEVAAERALAVAEEEGIQDVS